MSKVWMGYSPGQDFINIFLLVLYKKISKFSIELLKNSKNLRRDF
jgi:hypothetical protein